MAVCSPVVPTSILLQARTATECSYLEGSGPDGLGTSLRQVALYSSTDGNRGRSIFCLLLPATKQCLLVVCVPSGKRTAQLEGRVWQLQGILASPLSRLMACISHHRPGTKRDASIGRAGQGGTASWECCSVDTFTRVASKLAARSAVACTNGRYILPCKRHAMHSNAFLRPPDDNPMCAMLYPPTHTTYPHQLCLQA